MNLEFFNAATDLKNISRQGWKDKLSLQNPESVADHSFSMAIIGMVISDLNQYDFEKILKMTLLHDLAESKVGDFTPEQINKERKLELENNAFSEITEKLPTQIKSNYLQLWREYQEGTSLEARIVRQIDKIEMALQAKIYQKEHNLEQKKIEPFLESARKGITEPHLKELFTNIVEG